VISFFAITTISVYFAICSGYHLNYKLELYLINALHSRQHKGTKFHPAQPCSFSNQFPLDNSNLILIRRKNSYFLTTILAWRKP
jgi:hypothetical protein